MFVKRDELVSAFRLPGIYSVTQTCAFIRPSHAHLHHDRRTRSRVRDLFAAKLACGGGLPNNQEHLRRREGGGYAWFYRLANVSSFLPLLYIWRQTAGAYALHATMAYKPDFPRACYESEWWIAGKTPEELLISQDLGYLPTKAGVGDTGCLNSALKGKPCTQGTPGRSDANKAGQNTNILLRPFCSSRACLCSGQAVTKNVGRFNRNDSNFRPPTKISAFSTPLSCKTGTAFPPFLLADTCRRR